MKKKLTAGLILHLILSCNSFPFEELCLDASEDSLEWNEIRDEALAKLADIQTIVRNSVSNDTDETLHRLVKRDGYDDHDDDNIVVRCKHGYTGLFSFLALPLLMGNIMIQIMSMINVNVMIMATATGTGTGTGGGNNNNNNNNNNVSAFSYMIQIDRLNNR